MPTVDRVCIVTQALYPDILGGAPIGAHRLANALEARGIAVDLHTVQYKRPPEAKTVVEVRYRVERVPYPRMPWDGIGTAGNPLAWRMAGAVRRSPARVVHLRSHLFFSSVFGARGAGQSKAVVLSVHGVRAVRSRWVNAMQEVWMRTFARALFRRADKVVCLTSSDREEVLRYGARPEDTVILWNAPDETIFHPPSADEAEIPEVVWLGRHVEEKGLLHLVDAWAEIAPRHPGATLVLVGDGPLKGEREAQVRRLGLTDRVIFEPFQDQAAVAARLRRCAVFVLPSLREGFPISLVEAMSCGKPVVTTSGLAEIVGEGGTTVPAGDSAALAKALEAYLVDPARRAFDGASAGKRARQEYGMDRLAEAYLGVYESALARFQSAGRGRQESQKGQLPSLEGR